MYLLITGRKKWMYSRVRNESVKDTSQKNTEKRTEAEEERAHARFIDGWGSPPCLRFMHMSA